MEKETLLLLLVGTPARGSFAINESVRRLGDFAVVTVRVLLNRCRNGFLPRVRGAGKLPSVDR